MVYVFLTNGGPTLARVDNYYIWEMPSNSLRMGCTSSWPATFSSMLIFVIALYPGALPTARRTSWISCYGGATENRHLLFSIPPAPSPAVDVASRWMAGDWTDWWHISS